MSGSTSPLVAPFVGERFAAADLGPLLAPPYDVISDDRRATYAANPHNIVHLILPEGGGDRYQHAASLLAEWRETGVLVKDEEPSLYVLQQEFAAPGGIMHRRTGVIGAVAAEGYGPGRVRPHEKTHAGPKEDRLALMQSTRAMFEALFMLAPDSSSVLVRALERVTEADPAVTATLDGVGIRIWVVQGNEAEELAAAAGDVLYIADGHHRYETASLYREEEPAGERTLALIVPLGDQGLVVLPTHRLIAGGAMNETAIRAAIPDHFAVTAIERSELEGVAGARHAQTTCAVLWQGGALKLELKEDADLSGLPIAAEPSVMALDIAKIDSLVVDSLRTAAGADHRLFYRADLREVVQLVDSGEASVAVIVPPTGVQQVLAVADAGAVMPQKSTYFQPKVASGLVTLSW